MGVRQGLVIIVRIAVLVVLVFGTTFLDQGETNNAQTFTTVSAQGETQPYSIFLPLVVITRDDIASAESNLAVRTVSAGYAHACAVRLDGSLICWGLNNYGQASPPPGTFQQVSAGANHTCALSTDGTVACWGDDTYGQSTPPAGQFSHVTAGGYHSCARDAAGAITCWGWNSFDQLVGIPTGTFSQVAAGNLHTCALSTGGTVSCWGWNADGQSDAPAGTFRQVSAGGSHSCATANDGTATCWGSNVDGELNAPAGSYRFVGAGGFHTCGLDEPGAIVCWGSNGYGQLNEIPEGPFREISNGGQHTCGVREAGGTLACWGWNRSGQSFPPSGVMISAGRGHACAVRVDGALSCWGENDAGQADPPDGAFTRVSVADGYSCAVRTDGSLTCWGRDIPGVLSPPAGVFVDVSTGSEHACALDLAGNLTCWGSNADGKISPPAGIYSIVSAGRNHTCALRPDGSIACWGSNDAGQTIAPAGTFTQISAGGAHTCARTTLGALVCWGANDAGQATPESGTFAQVSAGFMHTCGIRADGVAVCWGANMGGESNAPEGIFSTISAGEGYSCGVRLDGTLNCWGTSIGTPQIAIAPTALPSAAAGTAYQAALTASGGTPPYTINLASGTLPEGLSLSEDGLLSGTPAADGTFTFTVEAADSGDPAFSGLRNYTLTVLPRAADTTPPVITANVSGPAGKNGWYIGPVEITWMVSDPESAVTERKRCDPVTLRDDTAGVTLTCTATSQGGTASVSVTIKIDQTPPTLKEISINPNVIYLNGTAKVETRARDDLSGVSKVDCPVLDTSRVGKQRLTCTAIDEAGNVSKPISASYHVIYRFKGFFPPLENPPAINRAVAGQTIPIKFEVLDANSKPVKNLDQIFIHYEVVKCNADWTEVDLSVTNIIEEPGLKHQGDGRYQFNWKTNKGYANSCKIVTLDLGDGSEEKHTFLVYFRK